MFMVNVHLQSNSSQHHFCEATQANKRVKKRGPKVKLFPPWIKVSFIWAIWTCFRPYRITFDGYFELSCNHRCPKKIFVIQLLISSFQMAGFRVRITIWGVSEARLCVLKEEKNKKKNISCPWVHYFDILVTFKS